jgi:hypothetical protein
MRIRNMSKKYKPRHLKDYSSLLNYRMYSVWYIVHFIICWGDVSSVSGRKQEIDR